MSEMFSIKIDVSKILKDHLYKGRAGTYLDIAMIPSKDSKYGDSHFLVQSLNKEARDEGKRGPIIGNAKVVQRKESRRSEPTERQLANQELPDGSETGEYQPPF